MIIPKIKQLIRKCDYVAGKHRYWLREKLFSKRPMSLKVEEIPFKGHLTSLKYLPDIDATILNIDIDHEYSYSGTKFDIIKFKERSTKRYRIATPYLTEIIRLANKTFQKKKSFRNLTIDEAFSDFYRTPHTAHLTTDGFMCATNIYCIYLLDTNNNKVHFLPEDFNKKLMCYIRTGGFSQDYKYFYFVRWPFEDSVEIRSGKKELARCEIGRLTIENRKIEIFYELELPDAVHQITCTNDDKYLLIACFNMQLAHFIPPQKMSIDDEVKLYKQTALKLSKLTTYDIDKKTHWETLLPVPTPAHIELDPIEPAIIYATSHNIFSHPQLNTILGGPGAIFKMRIEDGKTTIENTYSDNSTVRLTQHRIFFYKGKKYLVFTTSLFQFQIIDLENMTLWRKVRLRPDPPLDFSEGFAKAPTTFPSLDVSDDNLYIIVGNVEEFFIYDIEKDNVLDVILHLPAGRGIGHTQPVGK